MASEMFFVADEAHHQYTINFLKHIDMRQLTKCLLDCAALMDALCDLRRYSGIAARAGRIVERAG